MNIQPRFKIKELCLAGAADRGISYIGVFGCFVEHDLLDLKKLYCVSIGSLIGTLHLIGYTPDEMIEIVLSQDISDFEDISIKSVLTNGSVLDGGKYRLWVMGLINKKVDPMITFKGMFDKNGVFLNISAVSLDSGEDGLEYFNHETTPDMPIYYAVLASMAIPLLFPPMVYNNKRYIDGAVLENFPVHLLSQDGVGFRITSQVLDADLTNITYVMKIIDLISTRMRKSTKYKGSVYAIDASDYSSNVSFALTRDNKITLYYRGYDKGMECLRDLSAKQEANEINEMSTEDVNVAP